MKGVGQDPLFTPDWPGGAEPDHDPPLSVGEISRRIRDAIRRGLPGVYRIRGELSRVTLNAQSGHLYFALKDADAVLEGVMFRPQARKLTAIPRQGEEVICRGTVSTFLPQGKYQVQAETLERVGRGRLEDEFRRLHATLSAEGLFDATRKRPLPTFPQRVAVVTSRTAAGYADVLKVFARCPWVRIVHVQVRVQGESAAEEIARRLRFLDHHATRLGVEVAILCRGGGSPEDLWCFNDERIVRQIAGMGLAVVTGIGHEIDQTLADFAADYHAHTPTEAATVVLQGWRRAEQALAYAGTRYRQMLRQTLEASRVRLLTAERHQTFRRPADAVHARGQRVDDAERRLRQAAIDGVRTLTDRLNRAERRLGAVHPTSRTARQRERVERSRERLAGSLTTRLRRRRERLDRLAGGFDPRLLSAAVAARGRRIDVLEARLASFDPQTVLSRGFTLTTNDDTGRVVRTAADVTSGARVTTRTADGSFVSRVE